MDFDWESVGNMCCDEDTKPSIIGGNIEKTLKILNVKLADGERSIKSHKIC
jgi:hypothetical protein